MDELIVQDSGDDGGKVDERVIYFLAVGIHFALLEPAVHTGVDCVAQFCEKFGIIHLLRFKCDAMDGDVLD